MFLVFVSYLAKYCIYLDDLQDDWKSDVKKEKNLQLQYF